MSPESFAKSGIGAVIKNGCGYCAEHSGGAWHFSTWLWDGTRVDEQSGTVCYDAPQIHAECIVRTFDKSTSARLCSVFQAAIEQNVDISGLGIGAIYEGAGAVYFLPRETYRMAVEALPAQEYAAVQGAFVNPLLYDAGRALLFTQGVLAYHALTGLLPFPQTNKSERHADFCDCNYVRPEHVINGLNAGLAEAVNARLRLQAGSATEGIAAITQECLQGAVIDARRVQAESCFAARNARFYKRLRARLAVQRYFRRNRTQLTFAALVCAFLLLFAGTWIANALRQPTARGLTALQTVEMFYSGMSSLNVPYMSASSRGHAAKDYVVVATGFYVNARTRESMDQQNATMSLAEYLYFKGETTFWLHGLTNFCVNGIPARADYVPARICDFPSPAADIADSARTFVADYYLVRSESPSSVLVSHHTDTLTLEVHGKKWQITDIDGRVRSLACDISALRGDFAECVGRNPGALLSDCVAQLRQDERYAWLPTAEEMRAGAQKAAERFNLSAAKAEL